MSAHTALPRLCAEGATVIWTRARRDSDLTPAVREWLRDAGFVEQAFHAPDDVRFSVGCTGSKLHRSPWILREASSRSCTDISWPASQRARLS